MARPPTPVDDDLAAETPVVERAAARYAAHLVSDLGGSSRLDVPAQDLAVGPTTETALGAVRTLSPGGGHAGPAVSLGGAMLALHALAPAADLPGPGLLGERASDHGFGPASTVSCGGGTRLISCRDGRVALALSRREDWELVAALTSGASPPSWPGVVAWAAGCTAVEVRDRAVLLGLACSVPGETLAPSVPWRITGRADRPSPRRPRVLDFSALWAGPLCARFLRLLGCEVVKVEDPTRPDGSRQCPAFFRRMYDGVRFASFEDVSLGGLLDDADVVIEASRPRALAQRGLRAEDFAGIWVSITGYGRDQGTRIGYGDDAAVAGGLVSPEGFIADAVADPLTGVHAALAAWTLLQTGRTGLVDIALSRTAAVAAALGAPLRAPG